MPSSMSGVDLGGPHAGKTRGSLNGGLKCLRIFLITGGSSTAAIIFILPPHRWRVSTSTPKTRFKSLAQMILDFGATASLATGRTQQESLLLKPMPKLVQQWPGIALVFHHVSLRTCQSFIGHRNRTNAQFHHLCN